MPLVDRIHRVPAKMWSERPLALETLRSVVALCRELRHERYDFAIDLQGSIRSAVIARMCGARLVAGSANPREGLARLLYTKRVPVRSAHVIGQALEIVSAAMGRKLEAPTTHLPVDTGAEQWCDEFNAADARPLVLLAPTAGWGAKQWPAERFGVVGSGLAERGYRVLVNTPPSGEDPVADRVVAASGGSVEKAPCTLPQLTALLRRVQLVIAGDSGPLHLAAALHVPVVALYGPTDPARTGPYGTVAEVLRHDSSVTDHRRHAATEAGLAHIEAGPVLEAALTLLHRAEPHGVDND